MKEKPTTTKNTLETKGNSVWTSMKKLSVEKFEPVPRPKSTVTRVFRSAAHSTANNSLQASHFKFKQHLAQSERELNISIEEGSIGYAEPSTTSQSMLIRQICLPSSSGQITAGNPTNTDYVHLSNH